MGSTELAGTIRWGRLEGKLVWVGAPDWVVAMLTVVVAWSGFVSVVVADPVVLATEEKMSVV